MDLPFYHKNISIYRDGQGRATKLVGRRRSPAERPVITPAGL